MSFWAWRVLARPGWVRNGGARTGRRGTTSRDWVGRGMDGNGNAGMEREARRVRPDGSRYDLDGSARKGTAGKAPRARASASWAARLGMEGRRGEEWLAASRPDTGGTARLGKAGSERRDWSRRGEARSGRHGGTRGVWARPAEAKWGKARQAWFFFSRATSEDPRSRSSHHSSWRNNGCELERE